MKFNLENIYLIGTDNPKLDRIFAILQIVNKGVPEVTRFVLFVNVAPMKSHELRKFHEISSAQHSQTKQIS